MAILFIIIAFLILLVYSPYFLSILSSKAPAFEIRIQEELQAIVGQMSSDIWRNILTMLVGVLIMEALYFVFGWLLITHLVYRGFTLAFVSLELLHLSRTIYYLKPALEGRVPLEKLFVWKLERAVAMVFYTHAILGILLILWP